MRALGRFRKGVEDYPSCIRWLFVDLPARFPSLIVELLGALRDAYPARVALVEKTTLILAVGNGVRR